MADATVLKSPAESSLAAKNLILIASVIATLLVLLILFTLVLVTIIMRMKRKCQQLSGGGTSLKLNHKPTRRKVDKKLRQYVAKCHQQVEQMEVAIRPKCAQLFQQLHHDYLNELNHELIYTLGLPVWNYKTYLVNMLFPPACRAANSSSLLVEASTGGRAGQTNMTCSSMSNSTTNSLLSSTLTPKQQQQQQANSAAMSVYATIKSNSMLMQLGENSCLQQTASPLGNLTIKHLQLLSWN